MGCSRSRVEVENLGSKQPWLFHACLSPLGFAKVGATSEPDNNKILNAWMARRFLKRL